jgi:uncharacterized membrane protein YfcA
LTFLEVSFLFVAGVGAGMINAVIGSGSLLTFPTMVAIGFPPIVANVSGNIGVLPASFAGAFAYRKFYRGSVRHLVITSVFSAIGGISGALLLLALPQELFNTIVPILIGLAALLVVFGPKIKRAVLAKSQNVERPDSKMPLYLATAASGVYGGYFGAGQGIILLSFLALMLRGGLQRANAYKNVLAAAGNVGAAVIFIFLAEINWLAVLILAISSFIGGIIGGKYGQRIPEQVYRVFIVVIAVAAIAYFYLR